MKYLDYEKAFSAARLNKYLEACDGNPSKALILYRNNVKLCQKIYGVLNVFEVALRNAINEHYKAFFADSDWIRHQLQFNGMLANHPLRQSVLNTIEDLEHSHRYSNDRIVSSVSLGFWTHLFSRRPFFLGGQNLLQILPGRTRGIGQRAVYNELQAIKHFRNRIAHYEAICFNVSGAKDTTFAWENYYLIIKYIQFLGFPAKDLYYGLNTLPDQILRKIDAL